jgi:hypothetical protein
LEYKGGREAAGTSGGWRHDDAASTGGQGWRDSLSGRRTVGKGGWKRDSAAERKEATDGLRGRGVG